MARVASRWLIRGALACAVAGCGGDPPPDSGPSPLAHRNVMVIDEAIDLASADLQGKVVASFTAVCDEEPQTDGGQGEASDGGDGGGADGSDDGGDDGGAPPFEELKGRYIARLGMPSQACRLEPGISAKDDPLASIAPFRPRWNGMLRDQKWGVDVFRQVEWDQIMGVFDAVIPSHSFHGTSTAGTVAHDNPGVRLVLIERHLQDPATQVADYVCTKQEDLDQVVALLLDPDVREAYIHAPNSSYTDQFRDVVAQFNVGLINLSYGPLSRQSLEELQAMKGCATVDFRPYLATLHDLRVAYLAIAPPNPYLVIQAAGNESQTLDSGMDSTSCTPEDDHLLTVGSTTLIGTPSRFSNFGACVNVSAPGERVIAPYAGNWLLAHDGTSFAAPLIARFLSMTAAEPFDPVGARAALLKKVGRKGVLAFTEIPRNFFYAPAGAAATVDALVASGQRPQSESAHARILRELANADFEPVLAPLRALRHARR